MGRRSYFLGRLVPYPTAQRVSPPFLERPSRRLAVSGFVSVSAEGGDVGGRREHFLSVNVELVSSVYLECL